MSYTTNAKRPPPSVIYCALSVARTVRDLARRGLASGSGKLQPSGQCRSEPLQCGVALAVLLDGVAKGSGVTRICRVFGEDQRRTEGLVYGISENSTLVRQVIEIARYAERADRCPSRLDGLMVGLFEIPTAPLAALLLGVLLAAASRVESVIEIPPRTRATRHSGRGPPGIQSRSVRAISSSQIHRRLVDA